MQVISVRSLAARLSLGFGVILVLLLGMAVLSLLRMQALSATLEEITVHNAARSQTLNVMARSVSGYVQALGDLASTDLEGGPAVLARVRTTLAQYDEAQARLETLLAGNAQALALLEPVKTSGSAARELLALGEKLTAGRGDAAMAFQMRNEYGKDTAAWSARQQAWGQAVNALSDWQDAANATSSALATADARTARVLIIVGALLAFAFGSALAWWLVRDTRAAVREAVEATRRMARHDLSQPIDTHRQDEIGGLLAALETMRQNLLELATGVRQASDDINNASGEIAQGSQDLSDRTEEAASTLETALASIAQLTTSVQETTATAQETQAISTQTSSVAARSGSEMGQVVSTMREIDVASHKISDIISIIDGIAFQTNILALNAAVEAARAGEQGRGFAVVASEVRALAGRSAAAAKDISSLIHTSLAKVASGTQQVGRAGQTTAEVTSSVETVSGRISAIAQEVNQQMGRIGEVNQFVGQLDQMAHQNAALAEESAAAAASLRQQASQLGLLVSKFELGRPQTPRSASPRRALLPNG
ncbi:MAG: HAMP domain-containing protein [Simplicispira suum]|uniref:methyl-accepting chemotaxis protein n=1 Tax=Simplicispira suum TaxID=2109915 RepID=UPI001C6A95C7|nr:methyl-accepting chemotaxis protein [Simplicispira suum]MBW7833480.1 HAMP domain-containing protein [Simplicispira suum]